MTPTEEINLVTLSGRARDRRRREMHLALWDELPEVRIEQLRQLHNARQPAASLPAASPATKILEMIIEAEVSQLTEKLQVLESLRALLTAHAEWRGPQIEANSLFAAHEAADEATFPINREGQLIECLELAAATMDDTIAALLGSPAFASKTDRLQYLVLTEREKEAEP